MKDQLGYNGNNNQGPLLTCLTLTALFLTTPLWANTAPSQGKITFDRYYSVWINGQRCGYARNAIRQSTRQITSLSYVNMTIAQLGRDMPMVIKIISREKPTGELISMKMTFWTNGTQVTKTAVIQAGQLVVTTKIFAQKTVERFAVPPGGFATEFQAQRLIKPLLDKPGQRLELTVLSLEGGPTPFLPLVMEVIGPETIQAYSQAVSATKVKTKITLQDIEFTGEEWFDPQGALSSRVNFCGLDLYLQAAEKDQARKKAAKVDLTDISLIIPKVPLKNPGKASRAVYRLKLKNPPAEPFDLPQTDMQRVLARGQDYIDVQITRQKPEQLLGPAAQQEPQVPPELQEYLQSSLYLDWQNPAVKAAAEKVHAASQWPWALALALWEYVDRTIFVKNLEVYFDPASKVLASHQGDCTEHAVLLAALARARGLPSRVVTGLAQVNNFSGHKAVFAYHAWTEVWVNGEWISLDAALHQAPADVSHIALSVSTLNSSEPAAELAFGILPVIGNLEIEVLQQD